MVGLWNARVKTMAIYHDPSSARGRLQFRAKVKFSRVARGGSPKDLHTPVSDFQMAAFCWRWRLAPLPPLSVWAALAILSGCGAGELNSAAADRPTRPLYRPGQSLDARLCECRECFDRACCSGEPEAAEASGEPELGISISVCGRCVRRTWTVRGNDVCASLAPSECCAGSIAD